MGNPDYPHQKPSKDDPPWIEIVIYSIVGWFSQEFPTSSIAVAFGGYFKAATDPNDKKIEGLLVDSYGRAEIVGEMTETTLTFSKQYFGDMMSEPIVYRFEKNEDGKWHGSYSVPGFEDDMPEDTRAVCQTTSAIDDAFGIMSGKPRYSYF